MSVFRASCYCGEVNLQVKADTAVRTILCHCRDCRRAHAAPLYSCSYCPEDCVIVSKGMEWLKFFQGPNARLQRYFCSNCGTRLFNQLLRMHDGNETKERGVFISNFDEGTVLPEAWAVRYHVWCGEALPDVISAFQKDGLTKNSHGSSHPLNKVMGTE